MQEEEHYVQHTTGSFRRVDLIRFGVAVAIMVVTAAALFLVKGVSGEYQNTTKNSQAHISLVGGDGLYPVDLRQDLLVYAFVDAVYLYPAPTEMHGSTDTESGGLELYGASSDIQSSGGSSNTRSDDPSSEPMLQGEGSSGVLYEGGVSSLFLRGYRDAGGNPDLESRFLSYVIPCESGFDPFADNEAGHRGLTQFAESTWDAMMTSGRFYPPIDAPYFNSVFDPYLHGIAAARLERYVENTPGSTFYGQWSSWYGCRKTGYIS